MEMRAASSREMPPISKTRYLKTTRYCRSWEELKLFCVLVNHKERIASRDLSYTDGEVSKTNAPEKLHPSPCRKPSVGSFSTVLDNYWSCQWGPQPTRRTKYCHPAQRYPASMISWTVYSSSSFSVNNVGSRSIRHHSPKAEPGQVSC